MPLKPDAVSVRLVDRDNAQTGIIAPLTNVAGRGAQSLTASRALFLRFVPSRPMTVDRIAFICTTIAGADDAVDVGIYDSGLTKIVSAGATAGKLLATGPQTVTFTATPLAAGTVYYAAFSVGTFGGTAAQVWAATMTGNAGDIFGTANGVRIAGHANSSHPLPTGPVTLTATIGPPILAVRES